MPHTKVLRDVGYVNYYQYPPMRPLSEADREPLKTSLGFHEQVDAVRPYTLFLSIPYCRVRCFSCPFFKEFLPKASVSEALDYYLDLVEAQAHLFAEAPRFARGVLSAVYLGGGTASVLSASQVTRIVTFLRRRFPVGADTEITLEGNPTDLTPTYLASARAAGVNRVSLGYQSSHESILRASLNSPHTSGEGIAAIEAALEAGFHTVNVDLMYRMPTQTRELWDEDIALILRLHPQSITMNEYVVHDGSRSEKLILRGRLPQQVDGAIAHEWYASARKQILAGGYSERRVGTFTLPGHEQRYGNLSYERSTDCIGLGAGAYGFVNGHMYGVPSSADQFARHVSSGYLLAADRASTKATPRNLMERWVFFGFLSRSLERGPFHARFGTDVVDEFPLEFKELEEEGLVTVSPESVRLTELGAQNRSIVLYTFYSHDFRLGA